MIAYSSQYLDNRDIHREAAAALAKGIITEEEYHRILAAHPYNLYSPNIFVGIGLFILTALVVAAGVGLTFLIGMGASDHAVGILLIVWGLAALCGLEYFIHRRGMFQAGVDNALLWMAFGLLYAGLSFFVHMSPDVSNGIIFLLTTLGVIRYADQFMTIIAFGTLIELIERQLIFHPAFEKTIPFVFMALSVLAYIFSTRLRAKESMRHYRACLTLLRLVSLLSFYSSCNYYVVQHLDPSYYDESTPVPLGWLWWIFTAIVPIGYIVWGIRKKEAIPLWTGLALVAASVFTVRYYHHILSTETAMILAGSILIAASYLLIRYLRKPRHGFTSAAPEDPHPLQDLPIEQLIIAETFTSIPAQAPGQSSDFGGGSGGGAGAGDTY